MMHFTRFHDRGGRIDGASLVLLCALVALLVLLIASRAEGKMSEITPDRDAYVTSGDPTGNYGDADTLLVSGGGFVPSYADTMRSYLRFSTAAIPPSASIQLAYLYVYDQSAAVDEADIYRVTASWTEDSITWNHQPAVAGGSLGLVEEPDPNGWMYTDLTTLVCSWHGGSVPNEGIQIRIASEGMATHAGRVIRSGEYSGFEPKLVIVYDDSSATANPSQDSYTSNSAPNANYGTSTTLQVGGPGGSYRRSYLEFDLPALPADAVVEFARVRLYQFSGSGGGGHRVAAHRVTSVWTEASITWNYTPSHNASSECLKGPVGSSFDLGWYDWIVTDLVKGWYAATYTNYGLVIKHPQEIPQGANRTGSFYSREYGTASYHPVLEVYYSVVPPIAYGVKQDLDGVFESDASWGDFDGDGDLDLVICGEADGGGLITRTYANTAGTLATKQDLVGIDGNGSGCLAWGDYDNDGDLDLAIAGTGAAGLVASVYKNDGAGNLTLDASQVLTPVSHASVAWGDLDGDGDLDLYVQGHNGTAASAILYKNNPVGTLGSGLALTGLYAGSADWGDYDGDGIPDLVVTGSAGVKDSTIFYHNVWGSLANTGNHGIPGVVFSDVALGDYDNDGDLDAAVTGNTGTIRYARVYANTDGLGAYADSGDFGGIYRSSCAWGDHDADGDMDIGFCGYDGVNLYNDIWANTSPGFTHAVYCNELREGSLSWADVDEDGDLDCFETGAEWWTKYARVLERTGGALNTPPAPPTTLTGYQVVLPFPLPGTGDLVLSWNGASDAETPEAGLYYCVRVGTTPGGHDVFSGTYGSPLLGNVGQATTLTLSNRPMQIYYWSVRSIDAGLEPSAWAPEQMVVPQIYYSDDIDPGDDATVDLFYADSTFGTWIPQVLQVGGLVGAGDIARGCLMFYLGDHALPPGATLLTAKLHLFLISMGCPSAFYVDCWEGDPDIWDENTVSWNYQNPPPWRFLSRTWVGPVGQYTWDVRPAVMACVDGNVTLIMRAGSPGEGTACFAEFLSKDQTAGMKPYLEIAYTVLATGVEEEEGAIPEVPRYALEQNVPNPFNPAATIRFSTPEKGRVVLRVYDIAGREVCTLLDEVLEGGSDHAVTWNGRDRGGRDAGTGVYFYRLTAETWSATKKMVLLR